MAQEEPKAEWLDPAGPVPLGSDGSSASPSAVSSAVPCTGEGSADEQMAHLANVFHAAPVGLCFVDLKFRYVIVNLRFAAMYDQPCAHFVGRTVREALPAAVADRVMAHLEKSRETDERVSLELTVERDDPATGKPRTSIYLRTAQSVQDRSGAVVGFSISLVDITEQKHAEAALKEREEDLRYTVDLNPHIPWTIDAQGNIVHLSPRFLTLSGLTAEEATLEGWANTIHRDDQEMVWSVWRRSMASGLPFDCMYRMLCVGQEYRWMRSRAFPRRCAGGEIVRWYGTLEDIHERTLIDEALRSKTQRLEEVSGQLSLLVREDHLTGLANRRYFDDALRREGLRAHRTHHPLSLIMLDVDFFKRYNDTYGHPAGDLCLRQVAQALKTCLRRQGDVAARYGGEEFVMLLPETPEEGALQVAGYVCEAVRSLAIRHPASESGFLTISAGVASYDPEHDLGVGNIAIGCSSQLLESADLALYAAKKAGRNRTISAQALGRTHGAVTLKLTS